MLKMNKNNKNLSNHEERAVRSVTHMKQKLRFLKDASIKIMKYDSKVTAVMEKSVAATKKAKIQSKV